MCLATMAYMYVYAQLRIRVAILVLVVNSDQFQILRSYTFLFKPPVLIHYTVVYLDGKYYSWDTKHEGREVQQSQDGGTDD